MSTSLAIGMGIVSFPYVVIMAKRISRYRHLISIFSSPLTRRHFVQTKPLLWETQQTLCTQNIGWLMEIYIIGRSRSDVLCLNRWVMEIYIHKTVLFSCALKLRWTLLHIMISPVTQFPSIDIIFKKKKEKNTVILWWGHIVPCLKHHQSIPALTENLCPAGIQTYCTTKRTLALWNTSAGYWACWRVVNRHVSCMRAAANFECIMRCTMAQ